MGNSFLNKTSAIKIISLFLVIGVACSYFVIMQPDNLNGVKDVNLADPNLRINDHAVAQVTTFSTVTYLVKFTQSGLPSGQWCIYVSNGAELNNPYNEGMSSFFANGTYTYTVSTNNQAYGANGGSFTVNGKNITVNVVFSKRYNVEFTESGLPSGTTWYVNLSNGQSFSSTNATITFFETNGSYSYNISTANKLYAPASYSGSFTFNGAPLSMIVKFTQVKYTVTFTETGLPSGTVWYVNLSNGQSFSSNTSIISFSIANGSYSYTMSNISGYTSIKPNGTFNISGENLSLRVQFKLYSTELKSTEIYEIISVIAIIAVIGSLVGIIRFRSK